MKKTIFATTALLIVLSLVAYTFVPPSATAKRPVRWEYRCIPTNSISQFTNDATPLGEEGWELVAMTVGAGCFKRQLP